VAVVLAAATALAVAPTVAAGAAGLEGTWEIPNDAVNSPPGCSGFGGIECTSYFVGDDTLEMKQTSTFEGGALLAGTMKFGAEVIGSISASEETGGKVRIYVSGEGAYLFEDEQFVGTLSADHNTMAGACPIAEPSGPCFHWTNGQERRQYPWDAVRVGAKAPKTTTDLGCAPIAGQQSIKCTATVEEADPGAGGTPIVPSGEVAFTSTAGTLQSPACTLVALNAVQAACSDTYTPPAPSGAGGGAGPKLTAEYPGTSELGASSASFTLCADGKLLGVESLTTTAPKTNGLELNAPVQLHGCGFTRELSIKWGGGSPDVTVAAAEIEGDGTLVNTKLPRGATSGDFVLSDNGNTATLAGQTVDSWRNTDGFNFENQAGTIGPREFVDAFTATAMTDGVTASGEPRLLPQYEAVLDKYRHESGLCFGYALLSSSLADGTTPISDFGSASTPFGLPKSAGLERAIRTNFLKQFSGEAKFYDFRRQLNTNGADIRAQLEAAFGSSGYQKPVQLGIYWTTSETGADGKAVTHDHGHAVVAFAIRPLSPTDPGPFEILTYNSNVPFVAGEDSDPGVHGRNQEGSAITVESDGNWAMPEVNAAGGPTEIEVMPTAAVEGSLHLLTNGVTNNVGDPSAPNTNVLLSVTDPKTGLPVNLAGAGSGSVVVTPVSDAAGPTAASSGPGHTGIRSLDGPLGSWTEKLADTGGPVEDSFLAPAGSGWLHASAGTDEVSFDSARNSLAIAPVAGQAASHTATMTVISQAGAGERILTVSGPLAGAHAKLALAGSSATLTAAAGATVDVQLSAAGGSASWATYDAGPIHIGAGQTLTLTPSSWSNLTRARLLASLRSGHHRHTLKLRNRAHPPAARIRSVTTIRTGHSAKLVVNLATPKLAAEAGAKVLAVVRYHGRLLARAHSGIEIGTATHATVTLVSSKPIPRGSVAQFTVITEVDGTTPSTASTKRTTAVGR
jgi:hypothetical protein